MDDDATLAAHRDFFERFTSFWAEPSGARVAELIAPDAAVHFTGMGTISGTEYVDAMAAVLASMPDMVLTPLDHAGAGERLYIFWKASATVDGTERAWHGIDRFRLRDGMAIEEHVIFDSAAVQG